MNEVSAKIQIMRDQQLAHATRFAAVFGLLAVLSSISQSFLTGWHNEMYLYVVLYLAILGAVLGRNHLSFPIRAGIIVTATFIIGVAGLLFRGFAEFGIVPLFCCCILSTILFGAMGGIIASNVGIAAVGIFCVYVLSAILMFGGSDRNYLNSPITWLTGMISIVLCAGTVLAALGTLNRQVEGLVHMLENQNDHLLWENRLLKNEIEKLTRGEQSQ
jgi:hypothetical protein